MIFHSATYRCLVFQYGTIMRSWNDDPFTKRARREHYEARSVYKLKEIQKRDRILDGVNSILDLGASPGSWTQYCLEERPQAKLFAIDLNPMGFSNDRVKFLQAGINDANIAELINPLSTVDLVLSDMAPHTTGIASVDVDRSTELVLVALQIADRFLVQGGGFVAKLFMGASLKSIQTELQNRFQTTRIIRPEATRKQSREIFLSGKDKR